MSAISHLEIPPTRTLGGREAIYFSSSGRTLFGFYHPTRTSPADVGLVICKPFGYEATCSHRSILAFAEAAAAIGVPALRFDYLGTGDSGDIEPEADQIETWVTDVVAAALELQHRAGVRHVCLLGIRLGALVAVQAASKCPLIKSLALIAPVLTGRRYLNELHAARLASSNSAGIKQTKRSSAKSGDGIRAESMEFSGFSMSAATRKTLLQCDIHSLTELAVERVIVLDFINRGTAREWTLALESAGAQMQYLAVTGLDQMLMWAPMNAVVPMAAVTSFTAWMKQGLLRDLPSLDEDPNASAYPMHFDNPETGAVAMLTSADPANPYIERPVLLTSKSVLFGIVTEPSNREARKRAILFLSAGADYHIGPNGMHVSMARRWASRGCVSLRLDLGGIGDSGTEQGKDVDDIFTSSGVEDIRAAIGFFRERYQLDDVAIIGVCSGAYHALRAAIAGVPIARIYMINPTHYFWHQGMDIRGLQLADVVHETGIYRERLFSRRAWRKLLAGQLSVTRIAHVYALRIFLGIDSLFRAFARRVNFNLPNDLRYDLEELDRRGVKTSFIFARSEPGLALLSMQSGLSIGQLTSRYRIHIIDGGDHIFSHKGPRAVMEQILADALMEQDGNSGDAQT